MRRAMCGLVVVLALAGCGRPASDQADSPPRYESGRDVRDALVRSGLGCDAFQPVSRHDRGFGEEDAVENDSCRVDNEDVSISTWASLGQQQDWARTRVTAWSDVSGRSRALPDVQTPPGGIAPN
jgi:hypothetical protein